MVKKRAFYLCGIFISLFALLLMRISQIQLVPSKSFAEAAFRQRISNNSVDEIRGHILDRNSIPFTDRELSYTAFIKTSNLPKSADEREKVSQILGIDPNILNNLTTRSKPLMIETNTDASRAILEMNCDWVSIIHSLKRYGSGTLAKHVIGYQSKRDRIGQTGIEKAFDKELRENVAFEIITLTDASKNPIKGMGYRIKSFNNNDRVSVKLTLDYHIQKIVEDAMDKDRISGAVVVEDIATGDILAMASRPDYNQEKVEDYLGSDNNELFNKATASYNLGSVFKLVDVAALYENYEEVLKKLSNEVNGMDLDNYYCEGGVDINGLLFKCSSYPIGGHAELNLEQAFAKSCNSYFIEICQRIGYRNIVDMARKFGLGEATGISRQGIIEAKGSLPYSDGYFSRADIANIAIGQGVLLATPLQVADMVATVANGGIKNTVNIVDSIVDEKGNVVREIRVRQGKRIISKSTADKIKSLMEAATIYGTGTEAGMEYYGGAAGKTGSAETGRKGIVHAWFAGYFPVDDPKYAVAVFVEEGQYGGKTAAPVFANIARQMRDKGY